MTDLQKDAILQVKHCVPVKVVIKEEMDHQDLCPIDLLQYKTPHQDLCPLDQPLHAAVF